MDVWFGCIRSNGRCISVSGSIWDILQCEQIFLSLELKGVHYHFDMKGFNMIIIMHELWQESGLLLRDMLI